MSDDDAMQSDSPQNLRNRKKDRVSCLIEFPVLEAQVYSIKNVFILRKVWKFLRMIQLWSLWSLKFLRFCVELILPSCSNEWCAILRGCHISSAGNNLINWLAVQCTHSYLLRRRTKTVPQHRLHLNHPPTS